MKLPKFLDCTLRDGGYINEWKFSWHFANALYHSVSEAGADFIEVGFFEPGKESGLPWTNLSSADLLRLRQASPAGTKIAVMINYGSVDLASVPNRSEYSADLIRVATPKSKSREATEFAAALSERGYQTTVNYMGISNYTNAEILELLDLMNEFKDQVDYFYVADSFGSLLPKRTHEIFTTLRFGTDAALGFHPHNNLQLAFANCLEAIDAGVDIIDGSVFGMGRGAGNLFTDAMLAYYEQQDPEHYRLLPILQFADLYMEEMKKSYNWGYSLPQLLSGVFHCHPNYPTNLLREKAYTADDIYRMLRYLPDDQKPRFSNASLDEIKKQHLGHIAEKMDVRISPTMERLCGDSKQAALLVCGGRSVIDQQEEIEAFIARENPAVFSVNNPNPPIRTSGVFFGNRRRLLQYHGQVDCEGEVILGPEIHDGAEANFSFDKVSRVNPLRVLPEGESGFPMGTPTNSAFEAVLGLVQLGYQKLYICGLDGYLAGHASHYYEEHDAIELPDEFQAQNKVIAAELKATQQLAEQLGFELSTITPSQFIED